MWTKDVGHAEPYMVELEADGGASFRTSAMETSSRTPPASDSSSSSSVIWHTHKGDVSSCIGDQPWRHATCGVGGHPLCWGRTSGDTEV
eukprot:121036-Prymnesium_polylepis.1